MIGSMNMMLYIKMYGRICARIWPWLFRTSMTVKYIGMLHGASRMATSEPRSIADGRVAFFVSFWMWVFVNPGIFRVMPLP